ncbi:pyrokinin-1 receptor-like [Varroa jacobsoni]|uniref:G-protein coupled receptors family 1 profile domain-containing protein n=1 Tax=Varroa destructor TaxID=109461 RepID=A0A7M7JNF9_VARDE|nr:pyrokinin-1 receptor-like isoform X1 [Varroa destructor]XP_022704826.1 pyrokinin-1 receptor-like [Varroa jacobsoni]XP_022704827.1 pyrokinin-1 receptor-like [Varroa jacobsoni]
MEPAQEHSHYLRPASNNITMALFAMMAGGNLSTIAQRNLSEELLAMAVSVLNSSNHFVTTAEAEMQDERVISEKITMTIFYSVIFITGVFGNICTCLVIALNRYMHTATNYYLFSLSISDLLLLLLGLPNDTIQLWASEQKVSYTFCIARGFLSETATDASILTITAFTMERYVAICHPLRAHRVSTLERAVKTILIVWIAAATSAYPIVAQYGLNEDGICTVVNNFLPNMFLISTVLFFIMPLTVIVVLYVLIGLQLRRSASAGTRGDVSPDTRQHHQHNRQQLQQQQQSCRDENGSIRTSCKTPRHTGGGSKRAVVKMLVAVVISFFVCWTPFHIQRVLAQSLSDISADDGAQEPNRQLLTVYVIIHHVSGISYYLSATVNPILYQVLSLKFRQAMRDTFLRCCTHCCCGLFACHGEEQTFTTNFYNSSHQASGLTRNASTRCSTMGRNNFTGSCRSYSPTNSTILDRSGSNKLNNRGTPVTVANSDLLPEKSDSVVRRPLTDANGLLTVDVAPTIIQIPETKDTTKNKESKTKMKDATNRERLIALANNKTNGNPQVIVTTET